MREIELESQPLADFFIKDVTGHFQNQATPLEIALNQIAALSHSTHSIPIGVKIAPTPLPLSLIAMDPTAPVATKDACVFLLDLSVSMLNPYKSESAPEPPVNNLEGLGKATPAVPPQACEPTKPPPLSSPADSRLSSAIEAVQVIVTSLMLRSKVHEVAVILMGTKETRNR